MNELNRVLSRRIHMRPELAKLPYVIKRPLNGGRFADVYLARDANGPVVIKLARKEAKEADGATNGMIFAQGRWFVTGGIGEWSPDGNEILKREAEILERIEHPVMAKLITQGEIDGYVYLVLEYIEGQSWRTALYEDKIELKHFHDLVRDLSELSKALKLHGDIKPENLIFTPSGQTRVIDPSSGMIALGPSGRPERLLTSEWYNPLLADSDIPSLGALLIELLCGQQTILLAAPTRPLRDMGPKFSASVKTAKVIGHYERYELLLRMPLPREIKPAIPKCINMC